MVGLRQLLAHLLYVLYRVCAYHCATFTYMAKLSRHFTIQLTATSYKYARIHEGFEKSSFSVNRLQG